MESTTRDVNEEIDFLVTWLATSGLSADEELVQSAHADLGSRYSFVGQYGKAMDHFKTSLSIAEQGGNNAGQEMAHGKLGQCHMRLNQYDQAIQHHEVQLVIAQETGNKAGEAEANACLGMCYELLSQYDTAIKHNELCLDIAQEVNCLPMEGTAHGNLGSCHFALGHFQEAIQHHEKFRNVARQLGDKAGEATALGNLGNCYLSFGQTDRAISCHEESLNIAQRIGYVIAKGRACGNLGNCYRFLGQYVKAFQYQEMVLEISKHIGDKAGLAKAHGNIGNCYLLLTKYDKAAEHYEMCRDIAQEIGDVAGEGTAIGNLASCYNSRGQYQEAMKHSAMHVKITEQIKDKAGEGRAHANLGQYYQRLGQHTEAVEHYELALEVVNETGQKEEQAIAYSGLSRSYAQLGKDDKAEENSRKCVQCYEDLFENAPKQDQLKVSILDTFRNPYEQLAKVLLIRDKREEALLIAETGRSKALNELILSRRVARRPEATEVKALGLNEIYEVGKALDSPVLYFMLDEPQIFTWTILPTGKVTYTCSYSPQTEERDLTRSASPEHAGQPIDSLVNKAMALFVSRSIVNCEDRSLSFLYQARESRVAKNKTRSDNYLSSATTASDSAKTHPRTLRLLQEGISAPAEAPGEEMLLNNSPEPVGENSLSQGERLEESELNSVLKELYQVILAPVCDSLEGPRVVIVPDKCLSFVPFASLVDGEGRYVAQTLQVRLVPSLGTARLIIEHSQDVVEREQSPLIVGNPAVSDVRIDGEIIPVPSLPYANKEAEMIGKLLKVQPLTGNLATKEAFLQKVESANLIHIAAHGDEERGEILLAPSAGTDGIPELEDVILTMTDLEKKNMRAKLVVLSCCHSGRGDVRAEGVVGIARAFLGAGASAVLVTLWAINDAATSSFMSTFYEQLVRGERTGNALDTAMRTLRMTAKYRLPRYWAPFVLMGEDVAPINQQ